MDLPRASPRTSCGHSSLKSGQHSRQAPDAGAVEQSSVHSGGRTNGSPATESPVTKSSCSSSTTNSGEQPSSEGSRLSKATDDLRRPQPRRRSGICKGRDESTSKDEQSEASRRSTDESTTRSARERTSNAARGEDTKPLAQHRKRTPASPRSPRRPHNRRQDTGPGPPVPAPRRDVSPRPATPVDATPRTNDGKDLAEKAAPMEVKDSEQTLLEKPTATRYPELSRRGDTRQRRALIPRKSAVKDVVSKLDAPMSERSTATPAERRDGSVQPLDRSSLSAKPRPAPRSPYLKKSSETNDDQAQITKSATSGGRELTSTTDAPYVTAVSSLPAPAAAEAPSLPPAPCPRGERRSTCCATALRHDESVNDSLRGTRLSSPQQKEQSTAESHEEPLTSPHKTSDAGSTKLKASTENVNGVAAGSVVTSSKVSNYVTAGETLPTNKLEEQPRAAENTKTTEGVPPTTVTQDEHKRGSRRSQQVSRISDKGRRDNDLVVVQESSKGTAVVQESSKSTAVQRSAHTGLQSSGVAPKALPVGKQVAENTDKSVPTADAPNDVQKPPVTNENADEGKEVTGQVKDGEKQAKNVRIAPDELLSSQEVTEASQGDATSVKPREASLWFEDCRVATERVTTVVCLTLVVVILYFVARPMYVREAAAPIDKAAPCLDEWCDRLGLWLLPNKSNFAKDPCHNFYEFVCYDWSVGRENTSFLGSVVGSAYKIISDRIARSTMPALVRNDLDLFVAFTKVCLADPSFNDSVSEWMSLIRYEMGDDFLVLRSWNWSRIVQATIRHNLLYGLPTIAGVRVGRTQHQPNQAGLFLSVDACLITLFSLSSGDTPAIVSLLTEIIDELPEFGDVVNAATQVKRLALAINLKRGAPFEEKMSCRSLGAIARGVDASTWLKEINRYVPANMTLDNDSDVRIREVTRHSDLYHAFEGRPPAIRALYINLLTVGQILQYRQSHATNVLPKLRVCMHASRNAFRNLWVKLVMDVAGLQVQARYLEKLFEDIKHGLTAHLKEKNVTGLSELAVGALLNKTELRPLSGPTVENDTVYRAPQLSIGYHMPQYLVQTSAFQVKRSYNQFIDEYSLSGDREAITLKPTYNVDDLTISVHFFLLFPPVFYVYREEQFHNFATLGVLLAVELIREAGRRSLLDWQAAAERGQTCRLERATGSDAQIKELFIWELAVGAALRSLEIYAKRTMSPLETLHYGNQLRQVFFERFCMLSCMPQNTESTKQRCVLPSMNLFEFSVAFQCAEKGTRKCGET